MNYSNPLMEHEKKLQQQVSVQDGHIVINVVKEYSIPLASCSTAERLLGWVYHLTEKTWMTNEVMRRFIEVACRENGIKRESI